MSTSYLAAFLKDRDVPCPSCDYNLRDQQSDNCPECGKAIELWVRAPELKYRWWIIGFAAACLGSPWIVLILFLGLPGTMYGWEFYWAASSAICLISIIVMIIIRRRFLRLNQELQIITAAVPTMSCVVNYVIFIYNIR